MGIEEEPRPKPQEKRPRDPQSPSESDKRTPAGPDRSLPGGDAPLAPDANPIDPRVFTSAERA